MLEETPMKARSPGVRADGHSGAGTGELSGIRWVDRYRGSSSLKDLRGSFRDRAEAFVDALRAAGATVTISATYRPPQRAYLMHWAWLIVKRNLDPATVPPMVGVDINWVHEDAEGNYSRQLSVGAAQAMVSGFAIERLGIAPSLQSRHTLGYGIDMDISWNGTLSIPDADGNIIQIRTLPRSGLNLQLRRVGESYGVVKYNRAGRDEPHWSDNGA
jgi:hypothetical protein